MTTVSFAGLDLSFMKRNPLPKREKVIFRQPDRRSTKVSAPYYMSDISPFVNVATRDTKEISSRSDLREFEKRTGLVQVGDAYEGKITEENNAQRAKWKAAAEGHATGPEWIAS